jgi:hypothetical protein
VLVCGARFWLVDTCGSSVPFWDQWDAEGEALFAPLLQGNLPLSHFFAPHNEHRIVLTRLLALGLFELNGMWDPRLEMVVNAAIAAGTAALVAGLLLREIGWRWWRPVVCAVAVLWTLPYAWENTVWGFQSQFYLLLFFSFLALWGLCHGRTCSAAGWIGTASAVLACLTMASGFLAALAIVSIRSVAIALDRKTWRTHLPALVFCLLCTVVSMLFMTKVPGHEFYLAKGPQYFLASLFKNLSWPACRVPVAFLLFLVPVFTLARGLAQEEGRRSRARWFLLVLAVWVALQAGALAYGRGRFGSLPASRYQDLLAIGLLVSFVALLLEFPRIKPWVRYGWAVFAVYGLVQETSHDLRKTLPQQRHHMVEQVRRCRTYIESRDPLVLRDGADRLDIPYPKPDKLAQYLDNPQIRSILLFVPGQEDKAGWPTHMAKGFLRASRWIFLLGLLGLIAALWPPWVAKRGASPMVGDKTAHV